MNIHEAAKSGKVFKNPGMIGAWKIVDGQMVHRDNEEDFMEEDFIRTYCLSSAGLGSSGELYWMDVNDLLRTDWEIVD